MQAADKLEVFDVTNAARWLLLALWLGGCAGAAAVQPTGTVPGAQQESPVEQLARRCDDDEQRISELEARLALLEKESHDWREQAAAKISETVHIGKRHREQEEASDSDPEAEPARGRSREADRTPVQVVRLYEQPREPQPSVALPAPPPGVPARLPVVPLPAARNAAAVAAAAAGVDAEQREAYRAALRLVHERRWDDALEALARFADRYREGSLAAGATYWQGEIHYAQRQYADALVAFQALLSRFPASLKAADALLKVGLCHMRLGDQAMAERYFRQVREQYPSSDAARIASREGSS